MSSLAAQYVDGVLQTSTTSSDSLTSSSSSSSSVVDSDTFLSLLVAEMQNQDPLEPTSNTEWVSQYATFTQVEQLGEMADALEVMRANSLVGKEVIMKVTSESTGNVSYTRGTVDYITMENGKAYLNIGGSSFSMDDLDTVATTEYFEAYDLYSEFTGMIAELPTSTNSLDLSYQTALQQLYDLYNSMDDYQKGYLKTYASSDVEFYEAAIQKLEDLGATFTTTSEDSTTLGDILDAFNTKMNSLMTQMSTLTEKVEALEEAQTATEE